MAATQPPSSTTGVEALHRLKSTEPPSYLTPSPSLSTTARIASQHLFSSLKPYTPKSSPFNHLLIDSHFDAEQIWQQIDLQSNPLITSLKRHVTTFIQNPPKILVPENDEKIETEEQNLRFEDDDVKSEGDDMDDEDESEEEVERGDGGEGGMEDRFLNIKEMKKFMEDDEAMEYGLNESEDVKKKKAKEKKSKGFENGFGDGDDDDDDDDDDEDEENELGVFGLDEDEDDSEAKEIKYEDFFESKKKVDQNKKPRVNKEVEDIEMSEEEEDEKEENKDSETDDEDVEFDDETKKGNFSTHERQMMEQRAKK